MDSCNEERKQKEKKSDKNKQKTHKESTEMFEEVETWTRDVLQEHAKLCECIRGTHTASRERSPDGGGGEATSRFM